MPIEEVGWQNGELLEVTDIAYGPSSETFWTLTENLDFEDVLLKLPCRPGNKHADRCVDFSVQPLIVVIDSNNGNAIMTDARSVQLVCYNTLDVYELDVRQHLRCRGTTVAFEDDMNVFQTPTRYTWQMSMADTPTDDKLSAECSVMIQSASATNLLTPCSQYTPDVSQLV